MLDFPAGLGMGLGWDPTGLESPAGLEIENNTPFMFQ